MKSLLILFLIVLGNSGPVFSQVRSFQLALEPAELNFGEVNEKEDKVLEVKLINVLNIPLFVTIKQPFNTFGTQPFWIAPADTQFIFNNEKIIQVHFRPVHNVAHVSNLIINTQSDQQVYFVRLSGQGTYSKSYYSNTQNLSEEALKTALKTRLNLNYQSLTYNVARDNMYATIDNKNDSVTCIYTNRKARFNTRAGATANNFNTEHTFPQGFFNSGAPMVSDLFHLFPTDEAANGSRGNLPFGVATPPFVAPAVNAPSLSGGGRYEPQDSHKGNAARAMLYFGIKYQDYNNFLALQESVLKSWNKQFLPTPTDTLRNQAIAQLQNNRNPFIDYPQFVDRISRFSGFSESDSVQLLASIFDHYSFLQNDTNAIVIWNEGNKPIAINHLRIPDNRTRTLVFPNDTAFVLQPNMAKAILMKIDRLVLDNLADSLIFSTNIPGRPQIIFNISNFITHLSGKKRLSLQLFPNPVSTHIELKPISHSEVGIQIIDARGSIWFEQKVAVNHGSAQADVHSLPAGIYLVKATSNGEFLQQMRFVKE